jgi:hypothetical protein
MSLSDNRQEVNGRATLGTREERGATHDLLGRARGRSKAIGDVWPPEDGDSGEKKQ